MKTEHPKTRIPRSIEDYRVPYATAVYGKEEADAVMAVLKTPWLGPAGKTTEFEAKMAQLFGKKHALFVNSGSSANLLALLVNKFPKGGEVITPACTFGTTIAPIVYAGLIPYLVDSRPGTYNADPDEIEAAINHQTVAIMLPDAVGMLNDWPRLAQIAHRAGITVIQDSCDTQGAMINGKPSGSWADIVTTSSYYTHTITTAGCGGTVMMDDSKLRRLAEVFALWGRRQVGYDEDLRIRFAATVSHPEYDNGKEQDYDGKFVFDEIGFNLRATDLQAAFGLVQLARLKEFNRRRAEVTEALMEFFRQYEDDFMLPEFLSDCKHSLLAFPLSIRTGSTVNRKQLMTYLEMNGIMTRLLFAGNILFHPAYQKVGHRKMNALPGATFIMKNTFLLPNHHALTDVQLEYIFETFSAFMKQVKLQRPVRQTESAVVNR
ncbi:MAG: DegT/DnrJ/EryC1/StrS family aminotransferase [Patescibacteria group bacterium]|nr:DegT/DnrJ/EryC1/StrS family aminotransferase [Patescibacteria group bacterium]